MSLVDPAETDLAKHDFFATIKVPGGTYAALWVGRFASWEEAAKMAVLIASAVNSELLLVSIDRPAGMPT